VFAADQLMDACSGVFECSSEGTSENQRDMNVNSAEHQPVGKIA
jgi:hypothetical protein